jgi:hypothetical protein
MAYRKLTDAEKPKDLNGFTVFKLDSDNKYFYIIGNTGYHSLKSARVAITQIQTSGKKY